MCERRGLVSVVDRMCSKAVMHNVCYRSKFHGCRLYHSHVRRGPEEIGSSLT